VGASTIGGGHASPASPGAGARCATRDRETEHLDHEQVLTGQANSILSVPLTRRSLRIPFGTYLARAEHGEGRALTGTTARRIINRPGPLL
jgi:hypothetical protein